MAIDPTLLQLALELAAAYDPTLDTSTGSSFRTSFLDPLLTRIGGTPLEGDLEAFLVERLATEIPDIDVSTYSGVRDLVIRPMVILQEPIRREIRAVKLTQSLNNYAEMTRAELNALLGNYFTALQEGARAQGICRIYFPSPQSVVVTPLTQFSAGSGLNFFPTLPQSISSTQMSFNQEGSLYYFDCTLQAEFPGASYNIEAGALTSVVGISGVTKVTNRTAFTSGLDEESNEEAVARTRNSITIRNLITSKGATFVIPENFPSVDTLQVIGYGDPEMDRDLVVGPVTISDIPGGISGTQDPSLGSGGVHIGGKTDIYIYQRLRNEEDLDIEDITDKGVRVFASTHGYTSPGPATSFWKDDYGLYITRNINAGDLLVFGEDIYEVAFIVSQSELAVSSYLGGPSTLSGGLYERTYEIVRKEAGFLTIPLYDLVAEDAAGTPIIDLDDDPVAPVPGSFTNEQLLDGTNTPVKKADTDLRNISRANIQRPLLRVARAEFLDPLTLESSGVRVPLGDCVLIRNLAAFTGGTSLLPAAGSLRLYYVDPVNTHVRAATLFSGGLDIFSCSPILTGLSADTNGAAPTTTLFLRGVNIAASLEVGYRVEVGDVYYMIIGGADIGPDTQLTLRETIEIDLVGTSWGIWYGRAESNMAQDPDSGLYYMDVDVEAVNPGASGNKAALTEFSPTYLFTEGYFLRSTLPTLTFSERELPYLRLSKYVNDTTDLMPTVFVARALRLSYEYAGDLRAIQDFADDPDNRIVAEDVLIKHFRPSYVRGSLQVRDLAAADAKTAVVDFINDLDPTLDLEVSDLANLVYSEGATHLKLPLTLVAVAQNSDRTWSARIDQDSVGSDRIQHFIADEDQITVTQE